MTKTVTNVTLALAGLFGSTAGGIAQVRAQTAASPTAATAIVQTALGYVGSPYGADRSPTTGFSDIGFVAFVYNQNGIHLHLSWPNPVFRRLLNDGSRVKMSNLQPGDLVFFKNTIQNGLSHVGIFVGNGKFVHAEWYGYGVRVSSFTNDPRDGSYWAGKYLTARRAWQASRSLAPVT